MNATTTAVPTNNSFKTLNYYIMCSLSTTFALIAVFVSLTVIGIVHRMKIRFHSVRYLLMCNTCVSSIVYCLVQIINYVFLLFFPSITSDLACRWRAYFAYASICAVTYSYLIQAISRLFFSLYSTQHPRLTSFKCHYLLIAVHWLTVFILPLPSLITNDIYFRPGQLCWVPMRSTVHMTYTGLAYYTAPVLAVLFSYLKIYLRVRRATVAVSTVLRTANRGKRDLEVLRNIVILLGIYISGGFPTLLFMLTANGVFYYVGIVTITLSVAVEKVCTILLDRDLRQLVKPDNQVIPTKNVAVQPTKPGCVQSAW